MRLVLVYLLILPSLLLPGCAGQVVMPALVVSGDVFQMTEWLRGYDTLMESSGATSVDWTVSEVTDDLLSDYKLRDYEDVQCTIGSVDLLFQYRPEDLVGVVGRRKVVPVLVAGSGEWDFATTLDDPDTMASVSCDVSWQLLDPGSRKVIDTGEYHGGTLGARLGEVTGFDREEMLASYRDFYTSINKVTASFSSSARDVASAVMKFSYSISGVPKSGQPSVVIANGDLKVTFEKVESGNYWRATEVKRLP